MSLADYTIIEACANERIWRPWFRDAATWRPWFTFLRAFFGLPMEADDFRLYRECTGRDAPPDGGCHESWLICGRRAGKSFILALIACFLAVFRDWRPYLSPGEVATVMVLARDRRQARVIFRYMRALLTYPAVIRQNVVRETADSIELDNGVVLEIHTASYTSIRGYTIVALLLDELAFWTGEDSADPDVEIIAAARPAMATIPGAVFLAASSPYGRRGALWDAFRRHYAQPGKRLVWRASTRAMNPTVDPSVIAEALEEDPASAAAEYLAQFRSDIEAFITREAVQAVTVPDRRELPPFAVTRYSAFVDPSGGSQDSMTLAIAHRDADGRGILDAVREIRAPFSPQAAVAEFVSVLQAYGIASVSGDRYAGEWPREAFRQAGVSYEPAEKPKSDIYREFLPLTNSARIELLDLPRLAAQLGQLERRTARGGRDSIDHPPGSHDDVANAAAGVLVKVAARPDEATRWLRAYL